MLDKLVNIGTGAMDLAEARARLLARELEMSGVLVLAYACVALLGVVGVLGMLCALAVWISEIVGAAAALALLGATLLLLAGVSLLVIRWRVRKSARLSRAELQEQAELIKERLSKGADEPGAESDNTQFASLASATIETISKHPEAAASGLFAALSLLGPGRILRMLAKASAAASILSLLARVTNMEGGLNSAAKPQSED